MELFKDGDILGQIIRRNGDGTVEVDYAGTILTLSADDNELAYGKGGQTPEQSDKIAYVMREFKDGELKTSHGDLVTNPKQAMAIALSEAGVSKYSKGGKISSNEKTKLGREINLKMPNGESRSAQFALVEADDIIASHNHNTFYSNEGYPVDDKGDNINDRNYKDDTNLQNAVIEYAANLEPERLIVTSRTPSGTPIIDKDGIVVSGNNRTMSLKRSMVQHPENYTAYKEFLGEELPSFGFTDGDLADFRNPILVRIDYDIPALNTMELSKYNKDTKKAERPIDKAIKLGKQLATSERCQEVIGEIVGKYDTFSDFYSNFNDQKKLLSTLVDCNILTKQETGAFFYERGFTEQGKELIENLLAGLILNKESLLIANDVARNFRQIIITSLPVLTANSLLGKDSLVPELNEAMSIEGKIRSSKLDFDTWINQLSMFEERPNKNALYINRLLASGRNTFKKSFEKYNDAVRNTSGADMFGDAPSSEEIFEAYIVKSLTEQEQELIARSTAGEQPVAAVSVDTPKPQKMIKGNPFADGNYFKEYPENILAKTESGVSRWKKPITLYKGSIEDLDRIDVPENFKTLFRDDNPTFSVVDTPVEKMTDNNVEVIDNLEKAIKAAPKSIVKKQTRKKKIKPEQQADELTPVTGTVETYSLKEVYEMDNLNEGITVDDVRAFLWYQNKKGRPVRNPDWYEIAESSLAELSTDKYLNDWVKNGVVFYYNGNHYPAYEYLAGNVYDKYSQLVVSELSENVGADASYIIENYGKEVYDNQVMELTKVFQRKYDKRLIIKSAGDDSGLKLLPISKFAKQFMVKTLNDEMPFKWKRITAQSNKRYGDPDFLATTGLEDRNKYEFSELSLTNAFMYWLRTDKSVQIKQGINYADVIEYYIYSKPKPRTEAEKEWDGTYSPAAKKQIQEENAAHERLKSKAKSQGDRLFATFLDKMLTANDKVRLETEWNMKYNNNVTMDYSRIPVAFRMNKFVNGQPSDVRPEKREAVAFTLSNGSGLLAYDVGVGKTPSAIFTVSAFLDMGYCNRPLIVVPNQTYKQWISEFEKFCAHIKVNGLYNLDGKIIDEWTNDKGVAEKMEAGSVTIITYEGMKKLGFTEDTAAQLDTKLFTILSQDTSGLTDKQTEREMLKTNTKVEGLVGKALARTSVNIEDFGFDYLTLDEAHAAKKVFTMVAGEAEENKGNSNKATRPVQNYKIQSGVPSATAIKAYAICQYIQINFKGNTQLLTATPFTNSPLEIYSMLSMIGHSKLASMGLENLTAFFDTFIEVSYELIINAKLNPERRQIILGFNNLMVIQQLVKQFINHKTGESVKVPRPNKIVLPLKNELKDGVLMRLPEEKQVDSVLPLSEIQSGYMQAIKQYAEGKIDEGALCAGGIVEEDEFDEDAAVAEGVEIDESVLDADEQAGVRLLKAMNHARNLALSPYLFDCAGLGKPTSDEYIETSNKLKYVMDCITTIKKHHEKTETPMSGVVIYIERGVEYFSLIREYLINKVGFAEHEVGIISSKQKLPAPKMKDELKKEYVKNLFLGKKYNESTMEFEQLPDSERLKVLIGSSTIKEGINLQSYSSTLFNCFLPWNPTDVQQLEGRIYRQGNAFKNVRIVNPLMIDSIDIFMFQKLEEKTARINSVWETDGETNVLKTEEFNPKELKYSLIKDARVLAQMELIEDQEKIAEVIADLNNKVKRNETMIGYTSTISSYEQRMRDWLLPYRPKDVDKPIENVIKSAQIVLKKQTDKDGLPMEYDWKKNQLMREAQEAGEPPVQFSPEAPASKPYFFDDILIAVRNLKRFEREYLVPNNMGIEDLPADTEKIKEQIEKQKEAEQQLLSDETISVKTAEIIKKREELDIKEKSLTQVVDEFASLNNLLDDVKLPKVKQVERMTCPVLGADGKPAVDAKALRVMDECSKTMPQTRSLHAKPVKDDKGEIVSWEYTPERKKLHDQIVKKLTANAVCIRQDKPIAILMGGAPGSGKSTFLKNNAEYMTGDKIWKIDADEVREMLPEYKGWNSAATHEESREIVKRLLDNYDNPCKHDVLFDGTMNNPRKYKPIIKGLKRDGYKVFIAYMEVPKEVSVERALGRYRENRSGSAEYGRYVPMFVINEFFESGDKGFQQLKDMVDGYIKVDSLTGEIIEKGGEEIPTDRNYSEIFDKPRVGAATTKKPAAKGKSEKEKLTAAVKALKITEKYLKGKDKTEMNKAIKAMEITLKYL